MSEEQTFNPTPKRSEMTFGISPEHSLHLTDNPAAGFAVMDAGVCADQLTYLDKYFGGMRRSIIDDTEALRQFIYYGVVVSTSEQDNYRVAVYQRGNGAEGRLEGAYSLGFGGHVELNDIVVYLDEEGNPTTTPSVYHSVYKSALREIDEEVSLLNENGDPLIMSVLPPFGFLSDYRPEEPGWVGNTHQAVLGLVIAEDDIAVDFAVNDPRYTRVGWMTPAELEENKDKFESWSQLVIDNLPEFESKMADMLTMAQEMREHAAQAAQENADPDATEEAE